MKVKVKVPRHLSMHEMTVIRGGRKSGMTHKEIKSHIYQDRKMAGTYKGKGISTNTISRLLGKTHKETYTKRIEKAWEIHAKQVAQKSQMEKVRMRIKDPKERAKFDKFAKRVIERTQGRQYDMVVEYSAEDDTFYPNSP